MTLYLALAIFILGTLYRIARWFTVKIGPDAGPFSSGARISRAVAGSFAVLFSRNIFRLWHAFVYRINENGYQSDFYNEFVSYPARLITDKITESLYATAHFPNP